MKLNEQLKSYFTKCGHINASFYEGKACINVSLRFRTFYLSLDRISIFQSFFVHSFKMIFYVVILKKRLKTTTLEAIKRTDNSRFALRKKGTFEQLALLIARLKLFRTYKLLSKPLVL